MSSSSATAAESSRRCRGPSSGPTRWPACWQPGFARIPPTCRCDPAQVNGYPALVFRLDGEIDTVMALRIDDGLITGLYAVRNPEKLSHMEEETALRR